MTFQQSPYLAEQRNFPNDNIQSLTVQIDRSYIDIAQKINSRTIGLFALGKQIVTGNRWFLQGTQRNLQTLRQIYTFSAAGSYPHGIIFSQTPGFTSIYGTFTDGANWYPLPYVDASSAGNQVSLQVTPTNIVITRGATAPTITSGYVVLEWLSNA